MVAEATGTVATVATPAPKPAEPVLTPEQLEKRIQELTGQIGAKAMTDPVAAQDLMNELRKLMKSSQEVLEAKAAEARSTHEGEIKGVLQDAYQQIASYATENKLPAFTFIGRAGFAEVEGAPKNEVQFDWAGRSAKRVRKAVAGGGRKRAGTVYNKENEAVGSYDSAAEAVRQLLGQAKLDEHKSTKTGRPSRNAELILKDAGYEFKRA